MNISNNFDTYLIILNNIIIKQFYTNYGEQVSQGKLQNRGNKYLEEFPELDYIFNCNVIQEDVEWRPIG